MGTPISGRSDCGVGHQRTAQSSDHTRGGTGPAEELECRAVTERAVMHRHGMTTMAREILNQPRQRHQELVGSGLSMPGLHIVLCQLFTDLATQPTMTYEPLRSSNQARGQITTSARSPEDIRANSVTQQALYTHPIDCQLHSCWRGNSWHDVSHPQLGWSTRGRCAAQRLEPNECHVHASATTHTSLEERRPASPGHDTARQTSELSLHEPGRLAPLAEPHGLGAPAASTPPSSA